MAEDHKTVILSIIATCISAFVLFLGTVVAAGGISIDLIKAYVLPLFISAMVLGIFATVLFARNSGKLPWLGPTEPAKEEKPSAPKSEA